MTAGRSRPSWMLHGFFLGRGGKGAQHIARHVAGSNFDDGKNQDRNNKHGKQHGHQAPDDISCHYLFSCGRQKPVPARWFPLQMPDVRRPSRNPKSDCIYFCFSIYFLMRACSRTTMAWMAFWTSSGSAWGWCLARISSTIFAARCSIVVAPRFCQTEKGFLSINLE